MGRTAGLACLMVFLFVRVLDPAPLQFMRLKVFDFYQRFQPRIAKVQPVVIVDLDDESLTALGQWPWPRTRIARMIDQLTRMGAVAIAFDVIFPEPDRLSPGLAVKEIAGLDNETRQKLAAMESNDQVLGRAFARSRVIVGQSGINKKLGPARKQKSAGIAVLGQDPDRFLISYPYLLANVPELEATAKGRGLLTVPPDLDGLVRRVPVIVKAGGRILPALSTELLRIATGAGPLLIRADQAGVQSIVVGGVVVPTDRRGRKWVYFSPHDPKRFVSAKDVLAGTVPPGRFRGKLVIIGTSAVGLHDLKATPVDPAMPGVEVHVQLLENILTKTTLERPNYAIGAEIMLALATGIAIIALAPALGALTVSLLGAVIAALLAGMSWYLFIQNGILIDVVYALASSLTIFFILVFVNYFREEAQRRQVRNAFGQYLSPVLVEELAGHPEKLTLGGETKNLTILFSDVRGFTSISELYKDDPAGLTTLMNNFLTPISNAIIDHKGTIDKYMGDAVMAFWNAPLDDPDHAANACNAALDMLERLKRLNAEREEQARANGSAFAPIEIGIGINTADCVVGNLGSDIQFDYSVMGDGVNLASRLEGQTKQYGVPIIVGSQTNRLLKDRLATMRIDNVRVKGKTEPEVIHAVLGDDKVLKSNAFKSQRKLFGDMLALYGKRRWKEAMAKLAQCRKQKHPADLTILLDLYAERLKAFTKTPPPKNWDGVFTLMTK
jgi:adenylate cyclase